MLKRDNTNMILPMLKTISVFKDPLELFKHQTEGFFTRLYITVKVNGKTDTPSTVQTEIKSLKQKKSSYTDYTVHIGELCTEIEFQFSQQVALNTQSILKIKIN